MSKDIELESRYIQRISELAVTQTLKNLGLMKVWLSTNECRRLYGEEFRRMTSAGLLHATYQGCKKMYNREEIEATMAASLKQARLQLSSL